jgi:hypothetical protein
MQQSAAIHQRRRSSNFSNNFIRTNSQSSILTTTKPSHSRRSSQSSLRSPATPRPASSHSRTGDPILSPDFGGGGTGLGSLADELAEGWDEDGDVEGDESGYYVREEGEKNPLNDEGYGEENKGHNGTAHWDPTNTLSDTSPLSDQTNCSAKPTTNHKIRLKHDAHSEQESDLITPSLESQLHAIESLLRQSSATNDLAEDPSTVFTRVASHLKDLTPQTSLENHTTRLATAHNALSSHLSSQTRLLATLTHPLVSPLTAPPPPEVIDAILPLLTELVSSLPHPQPALSATAIPPASLRMFHTAGAELISTLSTLSDTLHVVRQTSTLAARRLRSTREVVATLMHEQEEAELGRAWVEKGRCGEGVCRGCGWFRGVC